MLDLQPVSYPDASAFIKAHHRHHLPPQGWKFGIGLAKMGELVGVITLGRPVARRLDNGWTLEVTRCCTDGTKNACSRLYGAARRAAFAMGYKRLITYILDSEPGTSLEASGYRCVGKTPGRSWSVPSRPRQDKHPIQQKTIWEATP